MIVRYSYKNAQLLETEDLIDFTLILHILACECAAQMMFISRIARILRSMPNQIKMNVT